MTSLLQGNELDKTFITRSSAMLIDNIFISQTIHKSFDSCVLINNLSDHMPSLLNIHNQKYDNSQPLEFLYRPINNKTNIKELNCMLLTTNWSTLSQTDVNLAFHEFQNKIKIYLDTVTPLKHTIIPTHKIWREPWITKRLSNSMNKCNYLYKKS